MDGRRTQVAPIEVRHYRIFGLWCPSCAQACQKRLKKVPGIFAVHIDYAQSRCSLQWDGAQLNEKFVTKALEKMGYTIVPAEEGLDAEPQSSSIERRFQLRMAVAWFLSAWVMTFALWRYSDASQKAGSAGILGIEASLSCFILVWCAQPLWRAAWNGLTNRIVNLDGFVIFSNLALWSLSFHQGSADVSRLYFDSVAMSVTTILTIRWFDFRSRTDKLDALVQTQFFKERQHVRVAVEEEWLTIDSTSLQIGHHLQIETGQALPVDGTLMSAEARIDLSLFTGESAPATLRQGDLLYAGTLNRGPVLDMKVTTRLGTRYIDRLLFGAFESETKQRSRPSQLERLYRWWIPLVLCLAATASFYATLLQGWEEGLYRLAILCLIGCPCPLLIIPSSSFASLRKQLQTLGMNLRRPLVWESLSCIKTIMWDKTGTLTPLPTDPPSAGGSGTYRDGIFEMLGSLRKQGYGLVLASGDKREALEVWRPYFDYMEGTLTVEGKARLIEAYPFALYIGDGWNDMQAVAKSQLSIAVQHPHSFVPLLADASLYERSVRYLDRCLDLIRFRMRLKNWQIAATIGYNLFLAGLAAGGLLQPLWAVTAFAFINAFNLGLSNLRLRKINIPISFKQARA
jgi:cation transport ATPase